MPVSSPQGPYEKYKARQAERERKAESNAPMRLWWFGQRDPVARFTLYVGLFTLGLLIVGGLQWSTLQKTNQIAESSERAWVGLSNIIPERGGNGAITVAVANSGRSPARDVRLKIIGGVDGAADYTLPNRPCDADCTLYQPLLLPGVPMGARIPRLEEAQPAGSAVRAVIRVDYGDMSGTVHKTTVCFVRQANGAIRSCSGNFAD